MRDKDKAFLRRRGINIQIFALRRREMSEKKELCLQEALDLLQNLPFEISDVLADDFSEEEVPANNLLEFSLDS
ncbi:hypothetical protein TNCV_3808201 [Trichonephila clavipes]|nr:hypothetical protein TNCV_3808201 [Trichonephila clavipes]